MRRALLRRSEARDRSDSLLWPVPPSPRLPRASSCAATATSTSIRRSVDRTATSPPTEASSASSARGSVASMPASRSGRTSRLSPSRWQAGLRSTATPRFGGSSAADGTAMRSRARHTDAGVTGRAIGDGRGRRYRRHELALADGGRLRIGVDGTIERIDVDGSTARPGQSATPIGPTRRSGSGFGPRQPPSRLAASTIRT